MVDFRVGFLFSGFGAESLTLRLPLCRVKRNAVALQEVARTLEWLVNVRLDFVLLQLGDILGDNPSANRITTVRP